MPRKPKGLDKATNKYQLVHSKISMASPNDMQSAMDKEQIFGMAEKEMEYRVELFNKLTQSCFNKCVDKRYKESELNMGENSCIDRCVSKYWHVTNLVGQLLGSGRPPM
ncbi:Mitochondrial import inner membrane translocase subunit TIM10, partial [Cucurbita argyrosperma subsp. sororia]